MIQFQGFKPEAMQRIAGTLGYQGDMSGFNDYLNQNPDKMNQMNMYQNTAMQMAKGGIARKKYNEGGVEDGVMTPLQTGGQTQTIGEESIERLFQPALPYGGQTQAAGIAETPEQLISTDSGQVSGDVTAQVTEATTTLAQQPTATTVSTIDPREVGADVETQLAKTTAATTTLAPEAQVAAQTQETTSISNIEADQGDAILMNNPVQRQISDGEMISGVANAATASRFNEQIEAATATPTKQSTVKGQLEGLMQDFEGGQTPAWAAGAMRAASATMAARGLGASSMAGQAVVQAAMEAALPIAQADAATRAAFEAQNLSNRQERAVLAAQQRAAFMGQEFDQAFQARVVNASKISDVANQNFTAEQQIALENSRAANTINLQNLNNRQAITMSEAAALSQLDMANLSNRQQAAVQNAQNFLQVDMANLSNQQQVEMFSAQQRQQALFTDQAAVNAAKQFNATSQNQTDQFFANLQTQTAQFNAAQSNAQAQFNAGEGNVITRFNAELMNQRDQFNAQNRLVIDQNNAQWRREIATADTAAINRANEINAAAVLDISDTAYNNLWQYYSDSMEFSWQSAENERDRINQLAITKLNADATMDIQDLKNDYASSSAFGGLIATMLTSDLTGSILGGIF
jgi:hypothetical protein